MSKTEEIAAVQKTARVDVGSLTLESVRPLLGPRWTIEGEDSERYEKILNRYPGYLANLIGSTNMTGNSPGVATRFCGKSRGGAQAGRGCCGARARTLSRGNSMRCGRARPMSRMVPTRRTGRAVGRTRRPRTK